MTEEEVLIDGFLGRNAAVINVCIDEADNEFERGESVTDEQVWEAIENQRRSRRSGVL